MDSEQQPSSIDPEYFFFFQAEDGIRDYKVTGVQTCALPILARKAHREFETAVQLDGRNFAARQDLIEYLCRAPGIAGGNDERSEERRVGKECRSRWSPYH